MTGLTPPMFEIWDILRPLVKLCLYPAMFVAAGGLIFELVFAPQLCRRHEDLSSKADYRRRLGRAGACRGAGDGRGRQPRWRLASATDTALLGLVMKSPLGLFSIVAGIGFAMITVMHRVKARGEQAARSWRRRRCCCR